MIFGKIVHGSVLIASGLYLAGCAVDAGDSAPVDGEEIAAVEQPWTVDSNSVDTMDWDSGAINNLSGWEERKCTVTYGGNYLLTDLRVYQEDNGSLDHFVGKLGGTCSDYATMSGNQTGSSFAGNIFTSTNFLANGGFPIGIASNRYPTGLKLQVTAGDSYVKDFQIAFDSRNAASTAITNVHSLTAPATGYTGTDVDLFCADQKVMTGLQLKYDTSTGKIRHLQIFCREITN
jgi:hypothetical protein